ncbi:hypothetical protein [Breoghania sp.]|uniref:hypothetical protein n=1 Tax=Breoghania sp. TaxID=2065378 RepID=UPI00263793AB|nr:hypothetical protein [Breoghania sp.]MDJ0933126.1 hypothetical protein [Breoghania sp.]
MSAVPPYRRPVNMVFQHYALFPHLSVAENVGYGLRQQRPRMARADIDAKVSKALETVRLDKLGVDGSGSFRAGSNSASRWCARSSTSRRSCCWMS